LIVLGLDRDIGMWWRKDCLKILTMPLALGKVEKWSKNCPSHRSGYALMTHGRHSRDGIASTLASAVISKNLERRREDSICIAVAEVAYITV
jgi:hypothetical protein